MASHLRYPIVVTPLYVSRQNSQAQLTIANTFNVYFATLASYYAFLKDTQINSMFPTTTN